ncbi:ABC transporter ATP-binding protein [Marinomonas sp. A3A]|uniref:ABC transporter ATP-binding protein n=1 Tax=Marinomonas sp. A3A TaxID=2065312 RepID=UPI001BB40034|nr:ABC transporter ATP-binding protein [Marinomonas sp. A3A]QUX92247.1 ABC transporter ATP-binding protein [Marinomonas sp. A3A]
MSALVVDRLVAKHGLLTAVRGVSFSVEQGEVLSVVGANGAGKTTLFRTLSGVHSVDSGSILLNDDDVSELPAYQRVEKGLAMVPEGRRLFVDMTVRENLQIAGEHGRSGSWSLDKVVAALPALEPILNKVSGGLSGGQRQAVAIGRALMCNPSVLLLDEVSLGLSPIAVEGLYQSLELLKKSQETTMIIVEQDLNRAIRFSDHLLCLLEGKVALSGRSDELSHADITKAYFGLEEEVLHA